MAKTVFQIYVVRNEKGQYLGNYRAASAQGAINLHSAAENTYSATFKSHAPKRGGTLTAKVEA